MNKKQFRQSKKELPVETGSYEVELLNGIYIPAEYKGGRWRLQNGDFLPENIAIGWR